VNNNLLILGGNSKKNISWLNKTIRVFSSDYIVNGIYYDHWNNDSEIDFDIELSKLEKLHNEVKDYYIVAKSVGSIISLMGIEKHIIKPKKIVIMGFPIGLIKKTNFNLEPLIESAIKETEILVIQQKYDPVGKYEDVVKELPSNIKVVEIPGHYHVYNNMKIIKPIIDNFFKENL